MLDQDGRTLNDRQSIADVFATFYEQLYQDTRSAAHAATRPDTPPIPAFTNSEIEHALKGLKSNKAADTEGIVAEMLKSGGKALRYILLDLFNRILRPGTPTPKNWKHTVIKVLYKSGDPQLPQNYRPIATIPILYKLFSRLLYNRLLPILDPQQSRDQAGFRPNCSTTDHLFTLTQIQEKANEWTIPVWTAAVDFKKAFDSVSHK
eukprot:4301053-Pyramimonas_sp.AAC.1